MYPTLFLICFCLDFTFYWSYFNASYPINLSLFESSFLLNTVHINVAYNGVIYGVISCPCKHKPAYSLNESLEPRPAHYNNGFLSKLWVILTIWEPLPAI